jgi:hypothetical protein
MATVLEDFNTAEQHSVARFLWAKGLNSKHIYKEIFPYYGGKCLSRKAVHNWVEKYSKLLPPSCEPLYATNTSHRKQETFLYKYASN